MWCCACICGQDDEIPKLAKGDKFIGNVLVVSHNDTRHTTHHLERVHVRVVLIDVVYGWVSPSQRRSATGV